MKKKKLQNQNQNQVIQSPVENKAYSLENTTQRWNNLFSSKYSGCDYLTAMQNAMSSNPYIMNQRLKQLKSQPVFYDRETLEEAIQDPGYHEKELREASWSLSSSSYPLNKLYHLYSDILTYKYYASPKYVDKDNMSKPNFKSDSKLIHMWLDKLQPEKTFRNITMEVIREGKRAYYLRHKLNSTTGKENVDYVMLQEMPSDWVKLVGNSKDSHFVTSFNFTYFWMPGTSVDQFPPIFRQYYDELMGCSTKKADGNYEIDVTKARDASDTLVQFSHGNWYYWKELPSDECWCFSMDESNAWQLPAFMGLFLSSQDLQSYSYLQQQLTSIPLYSMILAQIPFHDKSSSSGAYTNDMRLSPDLIMGFTDTFNSIAPPGTAIYPAPFEDMKHIQFQEVPNGNSIVTKALQQFISIAGTTGLQSTTEKPSVAMVKSSQLTEFRFIDKLYGQFKKFVDTCFSSKMGLKYTWKFTIFGNVFTDKEDKQALKDAISVGQTSLLPRFLAMYDQDIEDAVCTSDYMDTMKIYDKMLILPSSYTQSSKDNANGRTPIDDDAVENDSTADSKDNGTNTADGKTANFNKEIKCSHCDKVLSADDKNIVEDGDFIFCNEECQEKFIEENPEAIIVI